MHDLMVDDNVICDIPIRNKGCLWRSYNLVQDVSTPVNKDFSEDFKSDIV